VRTLTKPSGDGQRRKLEAEEKSSKNKKKN